MEMSRNVDAKLRTARAEVLVNEVRIAEEITHLVGTRKITIHSASSSKKLDVLLKELHLRRQAEWIADSRRRGGTPLFPQLLSS